MWQVLSGEHSIFVLKGIPVLVVWLRTSVCADFSVSLSSLLCPSPGSIAMAMRLRTIQGHVLASVPCLRVGGSFCGLMLWMDENYFAPRRCSHRKPQRSSVFTGESSGQVFFKVVQDFVYPQCGAHLSWLGSWPEFPGIASNRGSFRMGAGFS